MAEFIRNARVNPKINIDRSEFPFTLPVFKTFKSIDFHPQVTFLVGDNGSGKSTLLEAIAVAYGFSAEGGDKNHSFSTYDSHSELYDKIQLAKGEYPKNTLFLRAETFYNLSTYLDEVGGSGGSQFGYLHRRSHGEGFLDAISSLGANGLYLMDEPESALSITGQLTCLGHMQRLIDSGSQLIIATHSPILLGFGRGWIYEFTESGMQRVEYRETKQFIVTLDFLRNRGRYAKTLGLAEDDD